MSLSLDHLVIRVEDLEQTIANFDSLGFTVQRGGTHADGSTHNALIGLADGSYFELIAFLKDAPQHRWWDEGNRVGEGFVDYALLPHSVAATIEAAHGRGLRYEGPVDGGRVRPDGARLEWQIGKPATPDLPFLCGDITPRELRVAEGQVRHHRNGVRGVASLNIAVRDLTASVARYRALLGEPLTVYQANLAGYGVAFANFPLGEAIVTLLSPVAAHRGANDVAAGLAHDLRTHLAKRGEGLLGVTLHTDNAEFARTLPVALTQGAAIDLVTTR